MGLEMKILERIDENPELYNKFEEMIKLEEEMISKGIEYPMFEWSEIRMDTRALNKLVLDGILTKSGKRWYKITDTETLRRVLKAYEESKSDLSTEEEFTREIPDDLFDVIVGFDDLKRLLLMSLKSDSPTHFLFVGPPGTSKTVFLLELARLSSSRYVLGGSSTGAGISDTLFNTFVEGQSCQILIDELEKMKREDFSILLSLMETGIVSDTKSGKTREMQLNAWVFAAANSTKRIPRENLDRFEVIHIPEYTTKQMREVIYKVLTCREGCDPNLARYIASKVKDNSVRQAVRIARMSNNKDDVDNIMSTLTKYKK